MHRWRETFAEKLRERGIDAEATRQATHGATRNHPQLWQVKAAEQERLLRPPRSGQRRGAEVTASRAEARRAWQDIGAALARSDDPNDRKLAVAVERFSLEKVPASQREPAAPTPGRPGPQVDRSR